MNYPKLKKLKEKLYFTIKDLVDILNIKPESARVLCSRYTKDGLFVRLKNNFYVLEENYSNASRDYFLKISNFLQVPSYISFMNALSIYEITTQVQRNFFESASLKRTLKLKTNGVQFSFYKLKKEYYFDFIKKNDIFIATKEKAFIDSVYLYSFGKYKVDFSSLSLDKLDKTRVSMLLKAFPKKTKNIVKKLCKI